MTTISPGKQISNLCISQKKNVDKSQLSSQFHSLTRMLNLHHRLQSKHPFTDIQPRRKTYKENIFSKGALWMVGR